MCSNLRSQVVLLNLTLGTKMATWFESYTMQLNEKSHSE